MQTLVVERRGRVGWITLDRPERLNALTGEMFLELEAAAGIEIEDFRGLFPLRTLASAADAVALLQDQARALQARGAANVRVSMLEDVRHGRRLELDDVHGFLAAEADRLGVPAPLTRAAFAQLAALDATRTAAPR